MPQFASICLSQRLNRLSAAFTGTDQCWVLLNTTDHTHVHVHVSYLQIAQACFALQCLTPRMTTGSVSFVMWSRILGMIVILCEYKGPAAPHHVVT
jgi:hypothetical protein